jgi:5'-3' exonuclease
MYSLAKKVVVTPNNFEEFAGIARESFLMFKCLVGDASDNIAKVTTPSKAKKIATGIADMSQILSQDQVLQYHHNDKMMNLHESYNHQPNELPRMQQQLQQLDRVPNFDAFIDACKRLNLNTIVDNSASWRKTFFGQQNMTNLIKLLGLNK